MPELPEVETVCRGLRKTISGKAIEKVLLRRENLRIPFPKDFAKKLQGRVVTSISRRAKYILMHLDDGQAVIAHLGMSGRMLVKPSAPEKFGLHDHAAIFFKGGPVLVYNDARRFGLMTLTTEKQLAQHPLLKNLGPEPLDKHFSASYLSAELRKRNATIKVALMDQALVVGVGNIYASEALFKAGISPLKKASAVAGKAPQIIVAIRAVLKAAIASGGSTLRDYVRSDGDVGYFQHHFAVYGRAGKPCFTCGAAIKQLTQAGRSTFYCPNCQK